MFLRGHPLNSLAGETNGQSQLTSQIPPDNNLHYLEVRGRAELADDVDRSLVNSIAKKYMAMEEFPYDQPDAQRVTVTIYPEQVSTPVMGKVAK